MIQLFVNNREVLLPYDFSVTIIEENPEITSNGEYTLDITLSLLEPQNAIAFEHLDRLNKTVINKNAEGIMIIDNKSRFGKIVVIKNTDVEVTFQFIAGNSELNYNAKEDNRKIWELDFGTETPVDYPRASQSIRHHWYNFVCAPIQLEASILNYVRFTNPNADGPVEINNIENIVMQPYLLYYINRLPSLLGYTLIENILNTDLRAKEMFIVNSLDSLKYSDFLPDMTISEFIDTIELYFNVNFIVNSITKTISIKRSSYSIQTKNTVQIDTVLDSYIRDLSSDGSNIKIGSNSLKFMSDNNSSFFKYQILSDIVVDKCKIYEFTTMLEFSELYALHGGGDQFIIYRDIINQTDYVECSSPTQNLFTRALGFSSNFSVVNKFRSNGSTNQLELKIEPAEIVSSYYGLWIRNDPPTTQTVVRTYFQMPKSTATTYVPASQGITFVIENGEKKIQRKNTLCVSLYMGMVNGYNTSYHSAWTDEHFKVPFSYCDRFPEFGSASNLRSDFEEWIQTVFKLKAVTTLKIVGANGIISDYSIEPYIDPSKEFTFILEDTPDVNINNIFVINNIKYIPISLQREVSNKPSTVLAKCYAML